ncbi:MAG: shikimate kinase [Chlamydiia bacterium]
MGRFLSSLYKWNFTDLDAVLEKKHSMPVRGIFQKFQEPFFRMEELLEFEKLLEKGVDLVAVGGGAPLKKDPLRYTMVWIKPPLSVLKKRLDLQAPYLQGVDLDEWIYQREKTYADKAQIELELSGEDIEVDTLRLWQAIHSVVTSP